MNRFIKTPSSITFMRKELLIILAFVFLLVPVSALNTTLKTSYAPSETLIIRIDGAVSEGIREGNVELRREHVVVPFVFEVNQLGTEYYLWGIAPTMVTNYTLVLKDIAVQQGNVQKTTTYQQNFSVRGNVADYTFKPGFVTTDRNFELKVTGNTDSAQSIDIDFPYTRKVTISPGENTLVFSIEGVKTNEVLLTAMGMYTVPVYIRGEKQPEAVVTKPENSFSFTPGEINQRVYVQDSLRYSVKLVNTLGHDLQKVNIEYNTDVLTVQPTSFKLIKANETVLLNVSTKKKVEGNFKEVLYARSGNESTSLVLDIRYEKNDTVQNTTSSNSTLTALKYCPQLNGSLCNKTDTCSGTTVESRDGACCMGTCQEMKKSNSGALIGYLLLGIILLLLAFVWLRFKGKKPAVNPVADLLHSRGH